MIFVTVGTQLPFERMVQAVDSWVGQHPGNEVFMQLGETVYRPVHCKYVLYTQPAEWERLFTEADLVVSHAGMGTILKSLDCGKPLIIMPRLAALGEHRNDHQVATAKRFSHLPNLKVVNDAAELAKALDTPPRFIAQTDPADNPNLDRLIREIKQFVGAEERA